MLSINHLHSNFLFGWVFDRLHCVHFWFELSGVEQGGTEALIEARTNLILWFKDSGYIFNSEDILHIRHTFFIESSRFCLNAESGQDMLCGKAFLITSKWKEETGSDSLFELQRRENPRSLICESLLPKFKKMNCNWIYLYSLSAKRTKSEIQMKLLYNLMILMTERWIQPLDWNNFIPHNFFIIWESFSLLDWFQISTKHSHFHTGQECYQTTGIVRFFLQRHTVILDSVADTSLRVNF